MHTFMCKSLVVLQMKCFEVSIMICPISQHRTQRVDMIIAYLFLF